MTRLTRVIALGLLMLGFGGTAQGQVVSLLVGNTSNFNGIDRYSIVDGSYQGVFAGPGTGPPSFAFLTYGPDNNLYVSSNIGSNPVLKFNGLTGQPMGNFVNDTGATFAFGTGGDFFRIGQSNTSVLRYNGATGAPLGTFATGLLGAVAIHFGPGGDLFVNNLNSIRRFNGTTGAPLGDFVTPGSGGLGSVSDFLFTSSGKLLVSGNSGGANDKILQYDGTTGAFVGIFAQGNGLFSPEGIALGPDGNVYVASDNNSILRFDESSGNFLGAFVPGTVHGSPYQIQFTPFPVPEPASVLLCGLAASAGAIQYIRRRRKASDASASGVFLSAQG